MNVVFRIPISRRPGMYAKVSARDYSVVSRYKWAEVKGYAIAHPKKGMMLTMHRLIMGLTDRRIRVDHRDNDTLNNTRRNLRIATNRQNSQNRRKFKKNCSTHKGVNRCNSKRNPWQAYITLEGKYVHLGVFPDEISAAKAYNKAAKKHFGDFASLNRIVQN